MRVEFIGIWGSDASETNLLWAGCHGLQSSFHAVVKPLAIFTRSAFISSILHSIRFLLMWSFHALWWWTKLQNLLQLPPCLQRESIPGVASLRGYGQPIWHARVRFWNDPPLDSNVLGWINGANCFPRAFSGGIPFATGIQSSPSLIMWAENNCSVGSKPLVWAIHHAIHPLIAVRHRGFLKVISPTPFSFFPGGRLPRPLELLAPRLEGPQDVKLVILLAIAFASSKFWGLKRFTSFRA